MQHPNKHTCNIRLKQLKHLKHTLATYVYSHCNICNTRSTFTTSRWNICIIHLKRMKHAVATCAYLLVAPNGRSLTRSLTPARSSMPRRRGRTSTVRNASRDAWCGGAQCEARGMRPQAHKAQGQAGPAGLSGRTLVIEHYCSCYFGLQNHTSNQEVLL